jgi:Uma2 family endonuclease
MPTAETTKLRTIADLVKRLGGVGLDRVRLSPYPATIADLIEVQAQEGRLCELVEGVLVEKVMGYTEALLATWIGTLLNNFVQPRNLGLVTGPDGTVELMADLVRIPDVAFTNWDRMPGRRRPTQPVPRLVPDLAVEVLSQGNTPGEMRVKRDDYFTPGVRLVWEVDPDTRTVAVYTSPTQSTTLRVGDTLDGGAVLPGFTLTLAELFSELDRHG